jgi:hypothetical protein
MDALSPQGIKIIEYVAQKYGVSTGAVTTLLRAILIGNGTMAQFSHPELGGLGQWSRGGMTMIGDMFNSTLKSKVAELCSELAELLTREPSQTFTGADSSQDQSQSGADAGGEFSLFLPRRGIASGDWWGGDLGKPVMVGSQNDIKYVYFRTTRRLALKMGERVVIYDTGEHDITGISQQQSGNATLTFTSQRGLLRLDELRVVSNRVNAEERPELDGEPVINKEPESMQGNIPVAPVHGSKEYKESNDVFLKLERLAELKRESSPTRNFLPKS